MTSLDGVMVGSYDYLLVVLSALIAVLASYSALDLAERVTAARGTVRLAWLISGSGSEFSRTEVESSRAPADQFSPHRRNVANHNPAYYFTAMVVPWVVFAPNWFCN